LHIHFDLIYEKCENLNWNYIIYGYPPYFLEHSKQNDNTAPEQKIDNVKSETELLNALIRKKERKKETKKHQLIDILLEEVHRLKSILFGKEHLESSANKQSENSSK
jgi:hypothetical protein